MTGLGKIFVVALTVISVVLLGFSAAAVSTAQPWKELTSARSKKSQELLTDKTDYDNRIQAEAGLVIAANSRAADTLKKFGGDAADLLKKNDDATKEIAATREELQTTRTETDSVLAEVRDLAGQVEKARGERDALVAQIAAFAKQNQLIDDQVANLRRWIAVGNRDRSGLRPGATATAPAASERR